MVQKLINGEVYERHILASIEYNEFTNTEDVLEMWQMSDEGIWLVENCILIETFKSVNAVTFNYKMNITGYCKPEVWTWYILKWK